MSSTEIGNASLGAGSKSSQNSSRVRSVRESHAAAQFRDDANMKAALKFLTTLEDNDNQSNGKPEGLPEPEEGGVIQFGGKNGAFDNSAEGQNIFSKWEKILMSRLFKINHVLLKNHSVSLLFYHLIMFFEFLQILFFIFFRVEFNNEFSAYLEPGPVALNLSTNTSLLN